MPPILSKLRALVTRTPASAAADRPVAAKPTGEPPKPVKTGWAPKGLVFENVDASAPAAKAPRTSTAPLRGSALPGRVTAPPVPVHTRILPGAAGMADALVRAGVPNAPQLLARMPGVNGTLSHFAQLSVGGNAAAQEQNALTAVRHYAVQSGRPVPEALKA